MSRAVHVHHVPREAARHSRTGRVCWTPALRRRRRSIRSTRVIHAAARFAPSPPVTAVAVGFRFAGAARVARNGSGGGSSTFIIAGACKSSRDRAPPFPLRTALSHSQQFEKK